MFTCVYMSLLGRREGKWGEQANDYTTVDTLCSYFPQWKALNINNWEIIFIFFTMDEPIATHQENGNVKRAEMQDASAVVQAWVVNTGLFWNQGLYYCISFAGTLHGCDPALLSNPFLCHLLQSFCHNFKCPPYVSVPQLRVQYVHLHV